MPNGDPRPWATMAGGGPHTIAIVVDPAFLILFALKSLVEFLFLYRFAGQMQRTATLGIFPVAALLYLPYVVVFGFLGLFNKFSWKR